MSGNYADEDLVVMRDGSGPFTRTLRTIHQDAIRQAIENPDRGGISWIGRRAFDKMRTALEEHLSVVDKNGNRSNPNYLDNEPEGQEMDQHDDTREMVQSS